MKRELQRAQFSAGLLGLGLLRRWPFLDAAEAGAELRRLREEAEVNDTGLVDVLGTDDGYAAWAGVYARMENPLFVGEQPALTSMLDGLTPGQALDVACGTGRVSRLLADRGHSVVGVDASAPMLVEARALVPGGEFLIGQMHALPVEDGTFDVAVCSLALTHVADLRAPIAELSRAVRPGGRVVLSDIHPAVVALGFHAFFRGPDGLRRVVLNEVHWPSAYLAAFSAAGLTVRQCLEPRFDEAVMECSRRIGGPESLVNVIGMPYALIWECERSEPSLGAG